MKIIILLVTIWIFFKTIGYGIYEYVEKKNTFGGVIIFFLSTTNLIFTNAVIFLNY